jgi:beta-lactamase superfamily II metal-dependent hydrolase
MIAVALMLTGIGVIGIFTATVASVFSERDGGELADLSQRLEPIETKLDRLWRGTNVPCRNRTRLTRLGLRLLLAPCRDITGRHHGGPAMRRVAIHLLLALLCPGFVFAQGNGKLQIHYMDVGQGDGAVLISPLGEVVLFDDGVLNQCGKPIGYLQSLGITKIDYHIASHYHADHIGCAPQVLALFHYKRPRTIVAAATRPTRSTRM